MDRNKKAIYIFAGVITIITISIISYKFYIHKKYFEIEVIKYKYIDDEYRYNSDYYGFVEGDYYEVYRNQEVINISSDGSIRPISKEGNLVFNHDGQLFLRDFDKVYEVTDISFDYLFDADSLHYAYRIDNKLYYVTYRYNESYSNSYYELLEYDYNSGENKLISRVIASGLASSFGHGYDFLIEDDWLVFADAQDASGRIGLYNIKTNEIYRIIDSDSYSEGNIEDIKLVNGSVYFKIVNYSSIPSYGADAISASSDGYDYCYEIVSGKVYQGRLDEEIVYTKELNLKDKYQLDYVTNLSYEEIDDLFGYIEDPILIEPSGDLYKRETLEVGYFSFEFISDEIDIYYSFNQPNVMKYGQLYSEPFLIPVPEKRYVTNIYYYSFNRNTGASSRFMNRYYSTH